MLIELNANSLYVCVCVWGGGCRTMKALLVVTVDLSGSAPGIEIRWEGWRTEQEKKKRGQHDSKREGW